MTKDRLTRRFTPIQATSFLTRAKPISNMRRGENYVQMEELNFEEDSFFDFEETILNSKPAREMPFQQYVEEEEPQEVNYTILDLVPEIIEPDPIIEEPVKEKPVVKEVKMTEQETFIQNIDFTWDKIEKEEGSLEDKIPEKKKTFEFKQCGFVKDDGLRCKRQAPSTSDFCVSHRKKMGK